MKNTELKCIVVLLSFCFISSAFADIDLETGKSGIDNGTIQTTSIGLDGSDINTTTSEEITTLSSETSVKVCTLEYNPQCGIDGKTYANPCMVGEVKIAYTGECKTSFATAENFEKAEGLICSTATDGCNTFTVGVDGKLGAGTLKACLNHTSVWSCTKKDVLVNILSGQDLVDYLAIKSGGLSPKYIEVIDSTLQKYITKFGKDTNELKIFNLGVLAKAIDTYKTNLVNSKNTKNLHLKLAILNLLKFDTLKEIYLFNEAIASVNDIIKLKYSCDNNETFTIEIDKDDLTLNDNKTKMLYNLTRVVSADGEKFENETNMVWLKANSGAIFERNGTEFYTNCKLQ